MSFTEHSLTETHGRLPGRRDCLLSAGGHALLLFLGLITFSGSAALIPMGDGSISVSMISLDSGSQSSLSPDVRPPEELPAEVPLEQPEEAQEEVMEQPEEVPDEAVEQPLEAVEVPDELPVEVQDASDENPPQEVQSSASTYASLSGSGTAGAGVPGPGTYESRVFNAVRRGFRTSVAPDQSYRIILTIHPDGTRSVEVVRTSGILAFDRAVENALELAQIPPMPPGRNSPVELSIEFLGPE
jgi:outer membrane biosynthesis protein TonB